MSSRQNRINSDSKPATPGRKFKTIMTPVGFIFFVSFLTLMVLFALWLDNVFGFPAFFRFSGSGAIYWPLIIIGVSVIAWSVANFLRAKGTPVPFNPPPKLVTAGPYAYTRNPMLTGVFIAFIGLGLALGSISLTFIVTPFLFALNYLELKLVEEPELEKRLGAEYVEYKKRVPMIWPRMKKAGL